MDKILADLPGMSNVTGEDLALAMRGGRGMSVAAKTDAHAEDGKQEKGERDAGS